MAVEITLRREGSLGFACGVLIGIAAGMIGVGGGEFRIPVLLHVLRLPVRIAAGANTVIGLAVVVLAAMRRLPQHEWGEGDLEITLAMVLASLAGAWMGARIANRVPTRPLKVFVIAYLMLVGVWMIVEAILHADHTLMNPAGAARIALAAGVGFAVAAVKRLAGSCRWRDAHTCADVSLRDAHQASRHAKSDRVHSHRSGQCSRLSTHGAHSQPRPRSSRHHGRRSMIGVLIGAALLPYVDKNVLKGILGTILLLATACLLLPWLRSE